MPIFSFTPTYFRARVAIGGGADTGAGQVFLDIAIFFEVFWWLLKMYLLAFR